MAHKVFGDGKACSRRRFIKNWLLAGEFKGEKLA